MQMTTLGRTGLSVSVAGLGCGGHSRLGLGTGHGEDRAVRIVHAALDAGVTFIDTARIYETERVVGKALAGRRHGVVISTKVPVVRPGTSQLGLDIMAADQFIAFAEESLRRLGTDYVDILHLHGVTPEQYGLCVDRLLPALEELREQGKIRFFGLTERFIVDPPHAMLDRALADDHWDVVMTGFNMLNPSARHRVFPRTLAGNRGVLCMFAVRRALGSREAVVEAVGELIEDGIVDGTGIDRDDPLGFLAEDGAAASVIEAAYRFCRHEPGNQVILTGTGNLDHLAQNLAAIQGPPLPAPVLDRLATLFGHVDSVSGN